jgi:hypothetical protein
VRAAAGRLVTTGTTKATADTTGPEPVGVDIVPGSFEIAAYAALIGADGGAVWTCSSQNPL